MNWNNKLINLMKHIKIVFYQDVIHQKINKIPKKKYKLFTMKFNKWNKISKKH